MRPDAVAVIFGAEIADLCGARRDGDRIAGAATALGVGPEKRVGICVDAGCTWLPAYSAS